MITVYGFFKIFCLTNNKKEMKKIFFTGFLLAFIINSLQAQMNSKVNRSFEEKLPEWMTEYNVPAVGIGIIEDGMIKDVKVLGELKKGIPAPDNAIFNVGSITKPVVAFFILKMVEAGQWDLDEPLFHFWTDPDVLNDPFHKKLTTRHVLTHQTGFPNWRIKNPSNNLTFEFEPGTKFQYSGEGFLYLQRALENKFKQPLAGLMDSILFEPLGMKDSGLIWDKDQDESRYAEWHDSEGKLLNPSTPIFRPANAAGSMVSSIKDLCILGIHVINGTGLSSKLYNDMIKQHVIVDKHSAEGLGWGIIHDLPNGEYAINHSGWDEGVKTISIFLPKSKRGIVILTNGDNGIIVYHKIISESLDIGEAFLSYIFGTVKHDIITLPDKVLQQYIGKYTDSYGRNLTISQIDNTLKISGNGMPTLRIYPESEHTFYPKEFEYQFKFISSDSLNIVIDGKIENIAKKDKMKMDSR
jgi:CubicO group peptidase (beta-lactamase class C family)